eukprot:883488_1
MKSKARSVLETAIRLRYCVRFTACRRNRNKYLLTQAGIQRIQSEGAQSIARLGETLARQSITVCQADTVCPPECLDCRDTLMINVHGFNSRERQAQYEKLRRKLLTYYGNRFDLLPHAFYLRWELLQSNGVVRVAFHKIRDA